MPVGKLSRRLRARVDYLAFLGASEWPVLVSALGVLLGLVTILPSAVGVALSVAALLLGVLTLLRDVRQLRGRWSAYEFTAIETPFPTEQIPPPAAYPDARYIHLPGRGTALVSDPIDRAVADTVFRVALAEEPYRLPPRLRATAPHVLPYRTHGRLLFNGRVVGMRGEPLPVTGEPAPIRLHRARFFEAQCSNELCSTVISRRDNGERLDMRRLEMVDASGALRTLAASEMADGVGVSTVAFTADGWLVSVRQSTRNQASPGLLAPSGSGALEPRDVAAGGDTLLGVMRVGMERELCEETGIAAREVRSTRLVGFARWMERGARPEFFGLTALSVTADQVRERRLRGSETLYTDGVRLHRVHLAKLGIALAGGADLATAAELPQELRDDGSLPLLVGLRAAAAWTVRAGNGAAGPAGA